MQRPDHVAPHKANEAARERDIHDVSAATGLASWLCQEVLNGERRAGGSLRRCLVHVLGDIRCDKVCAACNAKPNRFSDEDLAVLQAATRRLLHELKDRAAEVRQAAVHPDSGAFSATALGLADLGAFPEVQEAAARLGGNVEPADLDETGVLRLIGMKPEAVDDTVVPQLAAWLSGQDVYHYTFIGLDACQLPDTQVTLGDWTLLRPSRDQLVDMSPVPRAHAYHRRGWDPTVATQMWWLCRDDGWRPPATRLTLWAPLRRPGRDAASTLIALALAGDVEPVSAIVRVHAERPGSVRTVAGQFPDLQPVAHDPDDVEPELGSYAVDNPTKWIQTVKSGHDLHEAGLAQVPGSGSRLKRGLDHLLRVNEMRTEGLDHHPPDNREVAFELAVVLEALVVPPNAGGITNRLATGCGWLLGTTDGQRRAAKEFARKLYDAASDYRHADEREIVLYTSRDGVDAAAQKRLYDTYTKNQLDLDVAWRFACQVTVAALAVAAAGEEPHKRLADISITEEGRDLMARDLDNLDAKSLRRWPFD